ncbi:TetR/AcrR family transcriptional regulator [Ahrensia kielensis]|uniref:TetR/AcrR family transcriptional regulator n=1 Tax=Ahrensia kielensis TaxID=76980 RepID=A0ABU9T3D4_9HYPH
MARKVGSVGSITAEAILNEACKLFARFGYAAVSMRQIAAAVGVQASAIYQHYPNKQEILVALLNNHMDALLEAWNNEVRDEDAAAALERFVRFHIRYHISRPDEVFLSYMELRSLEDQGFRIIERKRHTYENIAKTILRHGADEGTFSASDPHVAAMAILAMLTGVNTWYRSGGRLSQQKIEDLYVGMVMGSVGLTAVSKA